MATQIWAHRGASSKAPENTMEAFEQAVREGADGIELDVHLSADGIPVVIHDSTLERVSGEIGLVHDRTLAQLKRLDVSNPIPGYGIARIPALAEVYELINPTGLIINVEVKSGLTTYPAFEQTLIALERQMGMRGRVFYSSFNPYTLMGLREQDPQAQIGFLYIGGWIDAQQFALRLAANALHPPVYALEAPGFTEDCKRYGIALHTWAVEDDRDLLFARRKGVQAVITDRPAYTRELYEKTPLHPVV